MSFLSTLATLPVRFLTLLLAGYQRYVSPMLPPRCRFDPTCSQYAREALNRHGLLFGSYLSLHRVLRCHPLCAGGHDPVPEANEPQKPAGVNQHA